MTLPSRFAAAAVAGLLGLSVPALAGTVVIDFDGANNNVRLNGYYNGGLDSLGASGANLGVEFIDFVTAAEGGSLSQRYVYNAANRSAINVAAGFTGFEFDFGGMTPATLSVFSGVDGSGSLLGSEQLAANGGTFAHSLVTFGGIGKSVILFAAGRYVGLDELRFSMAQPVPEASGWVMALAGFGLLGLLRRRRCGPFRQGT
jgi:MYXO-CTERM domain-containing protein